MTDSTLVKIFEAMFNSIHEGIIVTDRAGKIIFYNSELAKLEQLLPQLVVGKHLTEVYDNVTMETSEHLSVLNTGIAFVEKRKTYFTKEGKEINIIASTFPVYQQDKIVAVYSICRDITKIKELLTKNIELQDQIGKEGRNHPYKNGTRYSFESLVFASSTMQNVVGLAKRAAEVDSPVLVFGETGTGKELLVQAMHNYSSRKEEPFVAMNCAAIPETLLESTLFGTAKGAFTGAVEGKGLFEQAGNGTLFLDEINSMSINLQAKLLRVLQERTIRRVGGRAEVPVRCRVVSSTNEDPWECINKGQLRKDLFYRLAVISLYIPPLREHQEDVLALIDHFLEKYQRIYGTGKICIAPELKEGLSSYQWPGNVRELEHIIESALHMLDGETEITVEHLPPYLKSRFTNHTGNLGRISRQGSLASILREVEKQVVLEALRNNRGNITRTAESLGIARQNLQYRMRKLSIVEA